MFSSLSMVIVHLGEKSLVSCKELLLFCLDLFGLATLYWVV